MSGEFELDITKAPGYEANRNLQATLCHVALSAQFDLKGADVWIEQPIKPAHAFRSQTEMKRDVRTLHRRWRDKANHEKA